MKVWISLLVIYSSFFIWYTDLGGKLTDDEIEYYANKFESNALKDGRVLEPRMKGVTSKIYGRRFRQAIHNG